MRQSIPYSQHQNSRWYRHDDPTTTTAGRTFNYVRPQYRNVNGYYGNYRNYHHQTSQFPRQQSPTASHPTTTSSSWPPAPGKRKFEASESESSTKTRQKVETEHVAKDQEPTSNIPSLLHSGHQASHRLYESINNHHHPKSQYHGMQNQHGYTSSRPTFDSSSKNQGSWQTLSASQYYPNENTPPAAANSSAGNIATNTSTQQEDLTCKGCLAGRDVLHLKLFHGVLTQAIYSNAFDSTDVMARQIPGCALVHDGLCFGFEKENGTKLLVVRGTGCLGMAHNHGKCQVCESKQSHVNRLMKKAAALEESPETILLPTTSINEIKMVPALAEAKMRQMECEIQDYKENSITVVNV